MSQYNVRPLQLDFKPSLRLACGQLLIAALGIMVLWTLDWSLWCSLAGSVVIGLATVRVCRQQRCGCAAGNGLQLDARGALWRRAGGQVARLQLLPSSYSGRYLVLLHYRDSDAVDPANTMAGSWPWQPYSTMLVCADSVSTEHYRRLRVYLRWGVSFAEPASRSFSKPV